MIASYFFSRIPRSSAVNSGRRPAVQETQDIKVSRGETIKLPSSDPGKIKTARLIQPSSTTHVTNIEQHSIAAQVTKDGDMLNVALPDDENLLPNGWYMLFFVDGNDRSSKAVMVEITN